MRRFIAFAAISLATCAAQAQQAQQPLQIFPPAVPALPKGEARVTVNYNTGEKLPHDIDAGALLVMQAKAHRAIYEIAAQECKLLLETVATECHIETINITTNVQQIAPAAPAPGSTAGEQRLLTNGVSAFRIKTKDQGTPL